MQCLNSNLQTHSFSHRTNDIPLFFAAKENSAGCIKKLLDCASTNIFERGALGETALHVAVLNDNMDAAIALMDGAPELINEPMTSDLFLGTYRLTHNGQIHYNIIKLTQIFNQTIIYSLSYSLSIRHDTSPHCRGESEL